MAGYNVTRTLRSTDGGMPGRFPMSSKMPPETTNRHRQISLHNRNSHWYHVTPFASEHVNQFRPDPPPALTSDEYSDAFKQVKALGILNRTIATVDQMLIGQFWRGAIQTTRTRSPRRLPPRHTT
jgi:hypothetical protein